MAKKYNAKDASHFGKVSRRFDADDTARFHNVGRVNGCAYLGYMLCIILTFAHQ
jgi:hypothetical protein